MPRGRPPRHRWAHFEVLALSEQREHAAPIHGFPFPPQEEISQP